MDQTIRIVLVEDHEMVSAGFAAVMNAEDDLEVVAIGENATRGIELIESLKPDVVVTDFNLPDGDGGKVASSAQAMDPAPTVLMITGVDDRIAVEAALATGCAGFVSKGRGIDELLEAVRSVSRGAAVFPANLLAAVTAMGASKQPDDPLTTRESEILQMLANANNADEIASGLFLSVHTVRNHIRSILSKLGARSQLEAVVFGVRQEIVQIEA